MKVKIDDTVYLQRYDIRFLLHIFDSVPSDVLHEIVEEKKFLEHSPVDGLEFSYTFKRPESIEWLMSQDAIVDFKKYSSGNYVDIVHEAKELEFKHYDVSFDILETRPKYQASKTVMEEYEIHKLLSLKILQCYEQHLLNFQIPKKTQKSQSLIWRIFNRSAH